MNPASADLSNHQTAHDSALNHQGTHHQICNDAIVVGSGATGGVAAKEGPVASARESPFRLGLRTGREWKKLEKA